MESITLVTLARATQQENCNPSDRIYVHHSNQIVPIGGLAVVDRPNQEGSKEKVIVLFTTNRSEFDKIIETEEFFQQLYALFEDDQDGQKEIPRFSSN